jgi:hypothetical protein
MGCDLDRFGNAGGSRDVVDGAFDEPVNEAGQPAGLVWFDALHACHVSFSIQDVIDRKSEQKWVGVSAALRLAAATI